MTLDPVVVQGKAYQKVGFDQRRQTGRGFFLDATQIARMGAGQLHELLARAPGFQYVRSIGPTDNGVGPTVGGGSIRVEGDPSCMNAAASSRNHHVGDDPACTVCVSYIADGQLVVDGAGVTASLSFQDVEAQYPPKAIAAIEMYGASAAPPGITSQSSSDCATIVIWTKKYLGLTPSG